MRLIDADAFIRFLAEQRVKNTGMFTKGVNKALNVAISALKNQQITPTVDAVPVVRFQEREKAVVKLRKKWQDAEMFICTMCGHFDHNIVGNIVYGNKDCGEIVGYPCCKKFTPWIPCSERMPEMNDNYICVCRYGDNNKNYVSTLFFYATDPNPHFQGEGYCGLKVTHWMPLPEPPKEEQNEQ